MHRLWWNLRNDMTLSSGIVCKVANKYKIIVCKVAAQDFIHLRRRLRNLMLVDFEVPQSPSQIQTHQEKTDRFCSSIIHVICLNRPKPLLNVSCSLVDLDFGV